MNMRIFHLVGSRCSLRVEFIFKMHHIAFSSQLTCRRVEPFLGNEKLEQKHWFSFGAHLVRLCSCLQIMWTMVCIFFFYCVSATAHIDTNRYDLDKVHISRMIIWRDTMAFRLKVIEWFKFWLNKKYVIKRMRDKDLITPNFDHSSLHLNTPTCWLFGCNLNDSNWISAASSNGNWLLYTYKKCTENSLNFLNAVAVTCRFRVTVNYPMSINPCSATNLMHSKMLSINHNDIFL